ncbi:type I-F CRISPR-associated helicase Cas3f [Pseudoalteromonas sp. Cnat2-41]|uniref:type I-F CRISPR-associated helicase Cas3f n=1 Tax=unclassified Pseudoalteromonas TaxID=194690 RepID=UPI001EF77BC1|nr:MULTISPECIES: type I-F CRISPR-associated helicase Cas3f [unclassified Pseudoalteromonas]MCF2863042.1 type I-F CRISPR-associated helicase Cas3f [Pseudoalteromonas sp. CNAT2-18]MCG7559194.1 type I-F CRISPR-associated helicase Cas3f [Pseudoalteromonas sp. CNAT2-18.1]
MMVTFVSQCEKNALKKTRRVLDAFANRIGDNTWQTVITQDGLDTVKKMLRKTASRSTAVSCHWIRSRARSQFLWVIGNKNKFNLEGVVPVNRTSLNLEHKEWEQGWQLNEIILLATSLAGLFHDFGKANTLFQAKLAGKTKQKGEPYRHEWVSLRLFEALVKHKADEVWLTELAMLTPSKASELEQFMLTNMCKDNEKQQRVFEHLSPLAKLVAWLVVSHHRLPLDHTKVAKIDQMEQWLNTCGASHWNSANALDLSAYGEDAITQNWQFEFGTPLVSQTWQIKAKKLATRALKNPAIGAMNMDWLGQTFVAHIARMSLMLADHYYSSLPFEKCKSAWRDPNYQPIANTDKTANLNKAQAKQQLDEHNIGVAANAQRFIQNLPALKFTLPAITQHRLFTKSAAQAKYRWQDKAFSEIKTIAKTTEKQGFFGVNMASTGCGKTIANARIMYALSDEREGCRFSVALGLRTLTLQTGDAYKSLLKLGDDELGVLVGSQAVKTLHQVSKEQESMGSGSESAEDLLADLFVSYQGQIYDGRLKHWLSSSPKLEQLVSAPVVVSTIDHLMPATESKRGGKQIAPMLRLLTSDLVLDEPDDFGLEDLPALCRLVNWAGMLGSRVLLSSATLPPALIKTLFDAYQSGREQFNQAQFGDNQNSTVVCAWIDEFSSVTKEISNNENYLEQHNTYIKKRITKLQKQQQVLRKGQIAPIEFDKTDTVYQQVASTIYTNIFKLHAKHHSQSPCGKQVSLGVVRMANINPMVATAKALFATPAMPDHEVFYCVYHSQYPLALRSYKETRLDNILSRHDENALWQQPEIKQALKISKANNLIFVVVGTSVVEVGRDHDYDWAIAEPSSMRSLIQLAGRIQRHRQQTPSDSNLYVLEQNIRALNGENSAYCKPGFESKALPLGDHNLKNLLSTELDNISAISRIVEPEFKGSDFMFDPQSNETKANKTTSFLVQEHRALRFTLEKTMGEKYKLPLYRNYKEANLWWRSSKSYDANWNAEFIRQTEFRKSQPQEAFILRVEEEILCWSQLDTSRKPYCYVSKQTRFLQYDTALAAGCHWWFSHSVIGVYQYYADALNLSLQKASEQLGEVSLRAEQNEQSITWSWHPQLGIYQNITTKEDEWTAP